MHVTRFIQSTARLRSGLTQGFFDASISRCGPENSAGYRHLISGRNAYFNSIHACDITQGLLMHLKRLLQRSARLRSYAGTFDVSMSYCGPENLAEYRHLIPWMNRAFLSHERLPSILGQTQRTFALFSVILIHDYLSPSSVGLGEKCFGIPHEKNSSIWDISQMLIQTRYMITNIDHT